MAETLKNIRIVGDSHIWETPGDLGERTLVGVGRLEWGWGGESRKKSRWKELGPRGGGNKQGAGGSQID